MAKKKKLSKTDKKVVSLSREESDRIGIQVEDLVKHEMKYIVNKYIRSYKNSCADVLGWDEDDLRQHMKILMWKGLATYKSNKNAKVTTYLSSILKFRMFNLSKRIKRKKHELLKITYCDVMTEAEETTDPNSAEDWTNYAYRFSILQSKMNEIEEQVLICHLTDNLTLSDMQKKLSIRRPLLIQAVKTLKAKMKQYLGEYYEEDSLH